jgi:hypothetical protein
MRFCDPGSSVLLTIVTVDGLSCDEPNTPREARTDFYADQVTFVKQKPST